MLSMMIRITLPPLLSPPPPPPPPPPPKPPISCRVEYCRYTVFCRTYTADGAGMESRQGKQSSLQLNLVYRVLPGQSQQIHNLHVHCTGVQLPMSRAIMETKPGTESANVSRAQCQDT
jgi:hypothetical protein